MHSSDTKLVPSLKHKNMGTSSSKVTSHYTTAAANASLLFVHATFILEVGWRRRRSKALSRGSRV